MWHERAISGAEHGESCCEEKWLLDMWGVLCGKAVAAMWVFPQVQMKL